MAVQQEDNKQAKKIERATTREFNTPVFMLRCCELGLSVKDLEDYNVGEIYDLMIEKQNDAYEYPLIPQQSDFDKFKR